MGFVCLFEPFKSSMTSQNLYFVYLFTVNEKKKTAQKCCSSHPFIAKIDILNKLPSGANNSRGYPCSDYLLTA